MTSTTPTTSWPSGEKGPTLPKLVELTTIIFHLPRKQCEHMSRQSGSPVHPARAARQWILPSARAAGQWIPPSIARAARQWSIPRVAGQCSIPPEQLVDPADYPAEYARVARQWIPPSIPLSIRCRWILPSVRPVSSRSGSPVFASGSRQYPARAARQSGLLNVPPGAQLGLHFTLVPSCFECTLRLGKGDAFVLLWVVNKQLRLIPHRVSVWKGLGYC